MQPVITWVTLTSGLLALINSVKNRHLLDEFAQDFKLRVQLRTSAEKEKAQRVEAKLKVFSELCDALPQVERTMVEKEPMLGEFVEIKATLQRTKHWRPSQGNDLQSGL
ncbi:hypothetical protein Pelo_10609 [Pelomyxa schiedti]|nr:hypothetical protein Pelo_10609 [Pelomyxa schiedti]